MHSVSFVSRRAVDEYARRDGAPSAEALVLAKNVCLFLFREKKYGVLFLAGIESTVFSFLSRAERGVCDSSRFDAQTFGVPKCLHDINEIDVPLVSRATTAGSFTVCRFAFTRARRGARPKRLPFRCSPFAAPPRARSPPAARSAPSGSRSGRSPRSARTTHPSRTTNRPFRWMPREVCWSTPWCTPTEP
jgi:hypothetical protein